jgi:phosphate transport system substrate-binding protein
MNGPSPGPGTPDPGNAPRTRPAPVVHRKSRTGALIAVVAVVIIVAAGLGVAYAEHWIGGSGSSSGGCGTTLQGDGAQIAIPLIQAWSVKYEAQTGNCVNYPGTGSGTGVTHFTSASIDFGVSDAPLSASQVAALPSPALTLPVTGSAITVVYNLPGVATTTHLNFTGAVLAAIWLGTITDWDNRTLQSLNPGVTFPNATITTVDRAGLAGTTYVFTDFLSQDNKTWASTVGKGLSVKFPSAAKQTAQSSNSALLSLVNSTADTIGYSDLTDVLALSTHSLGYAAVQNPSGAFVVPTLADTTSALADKVASTTLPAATGNWYNVSMVNANGSADYPLSTFIYMYVYQATEKGFEASPDRAQVLVQWLTWVTSSTEGQSFVSGPNLYYPALPASVLAGDTTGIGTMTYNGAAIS